MHLVDIPLGSYVYRFRRMSWKEEAAIEIPPGSDARELMLAAALHDVSGLVIPSAEERQQIIRKIPTALRWRLWVVYRGSLPADRYFTTKGLYQAPEYRTFNRKLAEEGQAEEDVIERRFGVDDVRETRDQESRIFQQALEKRTKASG